jgi:hypothetical protein
MVEALSLRESPGLPTFHSGGDHGDVIDSLLNRDVAAYIFEAFSPEHLASARNMFDTRKAVVIALI